ncbi:LPP20 lipoprotein [Helicobacter bizzozeronii]|uniref:LPP20 family lipoprotein n=1 Tax=Helicobacter bizzozeronii TaxID=56877 RepID=UPI00244D8A40|nr:LPP20 family lipoprotein [Helicobacter bizzozeronii]GMB92528.1 LPP20 lipoprotein [Helicobacter bizzozeronii]
MRVSKWVLLGSLAGALVIVGCGEPKSGVSKKNKAYRAETKDAPKWTVGDLNDVSKHYPNYSGVFLGRGEEDIVGGASGVDYATEQATMKARANLASNLKSQLHKEVQSHEAREGQSLNKTSSIDISQIVDKELVATKTLARWVGKDHVWVLVGLDNSIVDKIRSEMGMESGKK